MRPGRLLGLALAFSTACGGTKPGPLLPPAPAASVLSTEPSEKADLSPVTRPSDLFLVGRLRRPGPLMDTLGRWAGLPVSPRTLLREELKGMEALIAWDAPIELVVALPSEGRRHHVRAVVSVGLTSLGAVLSSAREKGYAMERLLPEVFGFSGPEDTHCQVGPALGTAAARLVCGDTAVEVEELFAYATRGLPNENLGERDLELELRAEPIRRRYSTEIAGARLLAGFLLRQVELDSPRVDRALADAVYGVADELVAEAEDTDSVRLRGSLDDAGQKLSLEVAWKFRSNRSWLAGLATEWVGRAGPAPAAFAKLPGAATSAGYTMDLASERYTPVRTALVDLADAYLEHEKVKKPARDRVGHLITSLFRFARSSVQSNGSLAASVRASDAAKKLGWRLGRIELPPADVTSALADVHALLGDRELWKILAKRFELDGKAAPKSEFGPLTGRGVPAGSRALVVTLPRELIEHLQKKAARGAVVETKEPVRTVVVVAPDGAGASLIVTSSDKKDAAERVRAFFAEGGARLGERPELQPLRAGRALHADFFTLLGVLESLQAGDPQKTGPLLPNHGESPIFASWSVEPGSPLAFTTQVTVPAQVFADLPGVFAGFIGSR